MSEPHSRADRAWVQWEQLPPLEFLEFFYVKVLEVLSIVAPTENPKKNLQLKVLNPIHIRIRDCPD